MFERLHTPAIDRAEDDDLQDELAAPPRAPGKRVRGELYAAAFGTVPARRRAGGGRRAGEPGKTARADLGVGWMPVHGTIAPRQAVLRLLAREVVDNAAPVVHRIRHGIQHRFRAAATATDATLQSEINAGGAARATAETALRAVGGAGQPLPPDLLERMGRTLGHAFGHVRIHTGPDAAEAARALGARAFTLGTHIYFGEGQYAPGTAAGDRLLRHELTHVVQHDQGRLHPRHGGAGLEVTEPDSAVEAEARAAEDRTDAPRTDAPRTADARTDAPRTDDARTDGPRTGGPRTDAPRTDDARTDGAPAAATGVAAPVSLGGAMIDVVRLVSPRLAQLIESGLEGSVSGIVTAAVQQGVQALVPASPLAGLAGIGASIADIAGTLIGAANGDAKCCATFATWCEQLGALARKAAKSKIVEDFKKGFADVDRFIGSVIQLFGGAIFDGLRMQLNALRELGGFLDRTIALVASKLRAAADFVLKQLGLPDVAAIERRLHQLAEKAWEVIKKAAAGALEGLKKLGAALYKILGFEALAEVLKFAGELVRVTKWLAAHRNDADIVKHAREEMKDTFLPGLLDAAGELVPKIQAAIRWCESHLTELGLIAASIGALFLGPLLPLAAAVIAIGTALKQLWAVIGPKLAQWWSDAKALVAKLWAYAKPVVDTFTQIALVTTNPWMAPIVLASSAWLALPVCFQAPVIDLLLDLLIAAVEASPDAISAFGPLWRLVRAGAIRFFIAVKKWDQQDKIKAVNRIATLGSGRNADMLAGFVVGFFKGVVYGVIDPFKMVYELLKISYELTDFFVKLAIHAPQVAAVIRRRLPELETRARQIAAAGRAALDDFLAGKIGFTELWTLLGKFMTSLETKAGELGDKAAGALKGWILGGISDFDIGDAIGIAVGYIIVFLLIAYLSGAISAEAEGALAVVRTIAKILNAPYELLGAMLKPLEALFAPVTRALAAIGERLGLKAVWSGAMRAVEEFAAILGKLVQEIILAIEGKLAAKVATLLEELAAKVGLELAEKLVAELGEKAAADLVERLGADLVKKLAEELSAKAIAELEAKLGKALIEQLVAKELTAAQIERLVALFERDGVEMLLAEGLTGAELGRLAALDEQALRNLLLAFDTRELLALEQALGKAGLERISGVLTGAEAKVLVDEVGATTLRAMLDNGLTDTGIRNFATLPPGGFASFAALETAELVKFGNLFPQAFEKFAVLDGPMLKNLAALDAETLRSFAFLDDAALRRFGNVPGADLAKLNGIDPRALRDFAALPERDLADLLANHSLEDIRILGNMTPERWAADHASAASLDAGGGHSFSKHGAHTTAAQQEARLRTGTAPNGDVSRLPPDSASKFSSSSAHTQAAQAAERDLYDNMVRTNGQLKREYTAELPFPGAGTTYRLVPPGTPPPPYTGGRVVEEMCNRIHYTWRLNPAGTDYVLVTMYPVP